VIAGPNGSGKTTFASDFLTKEANVSHFINADLIAMGLSPLNPDQAAVAAGRVFLGELERLARLGESFAFESTLSGVRYATRLERMKKAGCSIKIVYLSIGSVQLALRRIAARVKQGGHNVPRADVLRRFERSWRNFQNVYRPIADRWSVYDNSSELPILHEQRP
jgi:predicted ABC-type ATPase